MYKFCRSAAVVVAAFGAVGLAAADVQAPAPPKVIDAAGAADVTTLTAKIEAVDQAKRTVTLKGQMGHLVTLNVDQSVKNFAQVKAGDEIVVKYVEALSIKLDKGGAGRGASFATTGPVTAAPGQKPGVAQERRTVIVATVQGIDVPRQEVLLQGPAGNFAEVKVKDPSVIKEVKVGDNVQVTYTEAVVIDVVTPKK